MVQDYFSIKYNKGLLNKYIQRQPELKRYERICAVLRKLRSATGQGNERYFERNYRNGRGLIYHRRLVVSTRTPTTKIDKGSNTNSNVMIIAKSIVLKDLNTGRAE